MGWSKKRWQKYIKNHWLEAIGFIAALSALYYGCRPFDLFGVMDLGFAQNLSSEIFGIGLSISILKIMVDYYEIERWKHIQDVTFRAIILRIDDIISQVINAERELLLDLSIDSPRAGTDVLKKFIIIIENEFDKVCGDEMGSNAPKSCDTILETIDKVEDLIIYIHENVRWDLDEIQKYFIPRILQTPADQNVKDMLVSFDGIIREFQEITIPISGGVAPSIQTYHIGQLQIVIRMLEIASAIKDELNEEAH